MQWLKHREKAGASRWLLPFLIGFVTGVLLWNFGGSNFTEESGILDEYTLERIGGMELNHNAFFVYVLQQRLGTLWMLAMASSTFAGIYMLYAYAVWLGFAGGILLSSAVIRYGIKGILLVVTSTLPQYLLYLPAVLLMLCAGYSFCVKLYYPSRAACYGSPAGPVTAGYAGGSRKKLVLRYFLLFVALHVVVIMGAVLESYVNPGFVTRLLQKF